MHIYKYLAAMANAIKRQGGKICTNSHADSIEGGEQATVKVGDYTVTAVDANGCEATATVTIGGSVAPQITATATDAECGLAAGAVAVNAALNQRTFRRPPARRLIPRLGRV